MKITNTELLYRTTFLSEFMLHLKLYYGFKIKENNNIFTGNGSKIFEVTNKIQDKYIIMYHNAFYKLLKIKP